ncbi:hypothetical protein F0562_018580 [Nyssa sinensis]|uniref:ATP synthase F1 complex delta/epsilon subunit N-terminal domain-containing protein n=1 Tax=Nyssa sinensis TaxID=561372 RepID=A0A5J4ZD09_9ASTE|nr:hypothetical protein F0562_018580 [Nyssa sinensis]
MFRQATTRLLSRSTIAAPTPAAFRARPFSDVPASQAADEIFSEAWKKAAPNLDPPKTPPVFVQPRPLTPSSVPSKFVVKFLLPYDDSELSPKEVDMVIIPALIGEMRVLPGHVTTFAEMKLGVLSLHEQNEVTQYFVCGGFAMIHPFSVADIVTTEAVPLDEIDSSLVQKGLAESTQKLSLASTELEKVEAQIGVDLYNALNSALIA